MAAVPDPSTIFPDSYLAGSALMDKVDPASPDTVHLGKEDGEKYLLFVTSTVMKALFSIAGTVEEQIVGDHQAERREAFREAIRIPMLALANVNHACCQLSKRYDGDFIDIEQDCAINKPYDFTAEDNVETVNDQALRNAGTFSGDKGPDTPELLQAFLRSLYDIGRTSRLSEACMVRLVQRRTLLTARTLVDNYLAGLADPTAPGTLLKLVLYLEKNFSLSWRPPQARASLAHLPQKYKHTRNFVQLQARILQLSHLASLSEKEEDRPAYLKAHQLPVFMAALNREDTDLLLRLEAQRRNQALPALTLSSAVEHLLNHHAARNIQTGELPGRSESLVPQVSGDSAMLANQPFRSRRRRADSAPARRPQEDRQRSSSRQPPSGRQAPPARSDNREAPTRRQPIWEKYGVNRGSCLQCSSPHHRVDDPSCPYKGTGNPLPPSACSYPGCRESGRGGAHWAAHCKTRLQANAASAPTTPQPSGRSSRGRGSRGSRFRRDRSSRGGGKSSAARRLGQPDRAMQGQEQQNNENREAFFFED